MPFLKSPLEIYWVLTNKCNIDCTFCFMDAEKYQGEFELTSEEREFILHEIIDNQVLKVILTGGEPLLIPEIFHYIQSLSEKNIWVELTTNGIRLTRNKISRLKGCGLKTIQLSINGSYASLNDSLMGRSFDRIVRVSEMLLQEDFNLHYKVTVTRQNIRDVPNILRLARKIGVQETTLDEIAPIGRGFKNYFYLKPCREDLLWLKKELQKLIDEQIYETELDSFTLDLEEDGHGPICALGDDDIYSAQIFQYGDLYQCTMSSIWPIKNSVLEKGLAKAWQDLKWITNEFTKQDKLTGFCKTCGECGGGCRPLAYLATGDIWGDFIFCDNWKTNNSTNANHNKLKVIQ